MTAAARCSAAARSSTAGSNSQRLHALERRAAPDRAPRRARVEDQPAGDRGRRRIGAQDVAVAARQHRGRFEAQPHDGLRAARNFWNGPVLKRPMTATRPRISAVP